MVRRRVIGSKLLWRACTCGSMTVSVMPAGCRVSVRHILEVWTPSPVHFHTRSGQFDWHWEWTQDSEKSEKSIDLLRRVRCGTQYGLSVSRVQLSVIQVTSSHLPSHTAAAIASTDDIHKEAMACPGGKEEGRQLVHVTNVACRAGCPSPALVSQQQACARSR
jgi:hypothetical protein